MTPSGEGGGDEERDDELPTVVVLNKGDVGEEEYQKFREEMKEKSGCIDSTPCTLQTLHCHTFIHANCVYIHGY